MRLSLVVPCFQEAHRLGATFDGIDAVRSLPGVELDVLVVDDGSTDGTAEVAERLAASRPGVRVLREPHRGKGGAVRAGVLAAAGELVFLADADWSMPPEQVPRFLPPALDGYDVAIASREHPGSRRHGEPGWRHLMGRAFNALVRWTVLPGTLDSQCGFKCFERGAARRVFGACGSDGWAFDVEVLLLARRMGLRVVEVPIDWTYRPDSRLRPIRDGLAMAIELGRLARGERSRPPRT